MKMIRKDLKFNADNPLSKRRLAKSDPAVATTEPTAIDRLQNEPSTESRLTGTPDLLQSLGGNAAQDATQNATQYAAQGATQNRSMLPPALPPGNPVSTRFLAGNDFNPAGIFAAQGLNAQPIPQLNASALTSPVEVSRQNVEAKRDGYETALEHEREPDLSTARNLYENALEDHLVILEERGDSLDRAVQAAEEHEREPDLTTARDNRDANRLEITRTRRALTMLQGTSVNAPDEPQNRESSRARVDSAREGYELALEHEREPDLTLARQHYVDSLQGHISILENRTPALEDAVEAAQEHGRQPDLSTAEARLHENEIELRDTRITLSVIQDEAHVATENTTLELDDRGPVVAGMQDRLRELGYDPGISDGWFGANTLTALRDFQDDQINALEVQKQLANGREEIIALDEQISVLTSERRAATAGPVTQAYLANPTADPLALQSSDFAEQFGDAHPDGAALLASGHYDKHVFRGADINLALAEQNTNAHNEMDNHIVVQSIFDPVVADKSTTVDEYSVHINLPPGVDPESVLLQLASDMDLFLGGEFKRLGDFDNQGDSPEVGQVIDIDVKDGGLPLPFTDRTLGESPFNAPVIISSVDDTSFTVQTIEYNNAEHLLHGTREWGFEVQPDGSVKFYTRGISVEDIQAAEGIPLLGGAKEGEFTFWSAWVDGIENYATSNGGSVVDDTRITNQTSGPSGNEIWETLTPAQQSVIRDSQVDGHQREANRLNEAFDLQVAAFNEIRDIEDLDGSDRVLDAIASGDRNDILRAMDRLVRDNEDSDNQDIQDAVEDLEELYDDARSTFRLANQHSNEAQTWLDR